jgi:uncharacterized membrane protein YebE (DUF533 family)
MDAKAILDSLLEKSQEATRKGVALAEDKLDIPESGEQRDAMLDGLGKGAVAAGAVALLLGTRAGRKLTGTALKVGGLAAVGGIAYKTYTQWQARQAGSAARDLGTPITELAQDAANERSQSIVRAMIAAARSDGHIDDAERQHIVAKIKSFGMEQDITSFLLGELESGADARSIAALADSPEAAAEIYLASAMVIDFEDQKERDYMNELAKGLKLEPELARSLEREVTA